jgi:hypothetical protein
MYMMSQLIFSHPLLANAVKVLYTRGILMTLDKIMKKADALTRLISAGIVTPCNDKHDNGDYQFYAISGFDAKKVRLAVWQGSDTIVWSLAAWDDRDVWFNLGDRPDLYPEMDIKVTGCSWRDDCGDALKYGYQTPDLWIRTVSERNGAVSKRRVLPKTA